jgi:succinate dehydrogenase/fumarate reductase iron-sulfur protein
MGNTRVVNVLRFDPTVDEDPYYQAYDVPVVEDQSVLDVLDYIHDNLDGSLAYYGHAACHQGVCRRCLVIVNGKPSLACQTKVTGNLTLEPPDKLSVVRDLVFEKRTDRLPDGRGDA